MSTVSTVNPTAADVRGFFRSNAKRFEALSPEAQHTLGDKARGRLHAEVIKSYNKGRKPERQYVLGVGKANAAARKAQRDAAVKAGLTGKRGPLSGPAKEMLSQPKSETV